jgi:hypothetical protein
VNDSPFGPFRPFSVLWFPFALPAMAISALAWVLFYLANLGLAAIFDEPSGALQALMVFGHNLRHAVLGLEFGPASGSALLFASQILIALLLWSSAGVAVCRVQALRLAREEYLGYRDALAFGMKMAPSALVFPLIVGLILALIGGLQALLGSLLQIPYLDGLALVVLPIAYLLTFAAVGITLSSLFALGMLPGALAVECKGTLDAWGKCLNYLFARPLHVVLYLVLLKVFLCDIVLHYAFEVRVFHAWTDRALTALSESESFRLIESGGQGMTSYQSICHWIHRGVRALVDLVVIGFVGSAAGAGFTGMFLIFRRDVDGIDVGDIDVDVDRRRDPAPQPVVKTED